MHANKNRNYRNDTISHSQQSDKCLFFAMSVDSSVGRVIKEFAESQVITQE